jgi:hypothetical protein
MNIKNLTIFVNALKMLPKKIQNNPCDMSSMKEPNCKTPGCHASLIYLAKVPEIIAIYGANKEYNYKKWAEALSIFLLGDDKGIDSGSVGINIGLPLEIWAQQNPELWGNKWGSGMFSDEQAFGMYNKNFAHIIIIKHWAEVLERVITQNNLK